MPGLRKTETGVYRTLWGDPFLYAQAGILLQVLLTLAEIARHGALASLPTAIWLLLVCFGIGDAWLWRQYLRAYAPPGRPLLRRDGDKLIFGSPTRRWRPNTLIHLHIQDIATIKIAGINAGRSVHVHSKDGNQREVLAGLSSGAAQLIADWLQENCQDFPVTVLPPPGFMERARGDYES